MSTSVEGSKQGTNSISDRLTALIKKMNMSGRQFAQSVGKSPSNVASVTDGKTKPSFDFLEAIILAYPQLNRDWLLMGEGEMFRKETNGKDAQPDSQLIAHLSKVVNDALSERDLYREQLLAKDRQIEILQQTIQVLAGKFKGVSSKANALADAYLLLSVFGYTQFSQAENRLN